jgi:hypothetical protein
LPNLTEIWRSSPNHLFSTGINDARQSLAKVGLGVSRMERNMAFVEGFLAAYALSALVLLVAYMRAPLASDNFDAIGHSAFQ